MMIKALDTAFSLNHNAEPLPDELARRFDVVIGMDEHRTVEKGTSIATYGLGGCIGGYIDNPETSTFFHYGPLGDELINLLVARHCSEKTVKLHLFVPGEWELNDTTEKYEQVPKADYINKFLAPALQSGREQGVEVEFHCYSEHLNFGDRYQGTAWVDANGAVCNGGMFVANAPEPSNAPLAIKLDYKNN